MGDPVKPLLPQAAFGEGVAQAAQKLAAFGFRVFGHLTFCRSWYRTGAFSVLKSYWEESGNGFGRSPLGQKCSETRYDGYLAIGYGRQGICKGKAQGHQHVSAVVFSGGKSLRDGTVSHCIYMIHVKIVAKPCGFGVGLAHDLAIRPGWLVRNCCIQ